MLFLIARLATNYTVLAIDPDYVTKKSVIVCPIKQIYVTSRIIKLVKENNGILAVSKCTLFCYRFCNVIQKVNDADPYHDEL